MTADLDRDDSASIGADLLDDREEALAARESLEDARESRVRKIIAAADERDDQADERDAAAEERDKAASLAAFLSDHDAYDVALGARRSAAVDRMDSKIDRTSSAQDRSELVGNESDESPGS